MGKFDPHGDYRFIYTDHSGQETVMYVDALDDDDAVSYAKTVQRGLDVQVWKNWTQIARLKPIHILDGYDVLSRTQETT